MSKNKHGGCGFTHRKTERVGFILFNFSFRVENLARNIVLHVVEFVKVTSTIEAFHPLLIRTPNNKNFGLSSCRFVLPLKQKTRDIDTLSSYWPALDSVILSGQAWSGHCHKHRNQPQWIFMNLCITDWFSRTSLLFAIDLCPPNIMMGFQWHLRTYKSQKVICFLNAAYSFDPDCNGTFIELHEDAAWKRPRVKDLFLWFDVCAQRDQLFLWSLFPWLFPCLSCCFSGFVCWDDHAEMKPVSPYPECKLYAWSGECQETSPKTNPATIPPQYANTQVKTQDFQWKACTHIPCPCQKNKKERAVVCVQKRVPRPQPPQHGHVEESPSCICM